MNEIDVTKVKVNNSFANLFYVKEGKNLNKSLLAYEVFMSWYSFGDMEIVVTCPEDELIKLNFGTGEDAYYRMHLLYNWINEQQLKRVGVESKSMFRRIMDAIKDE